MTELMKELFSKVVCGLIVAFITSNKENKLGVIFNQNIRIRTTLFVDHSTEDRLSQSSCPYLVTVQVFQAFQLILLVVAVHV